MKANIDNEIRMYQIRMKKKELYGRVRDFERSRQPFASPYHFVVPWEKPEEVQESRENYGCRGPQKNNPVFNQYF